MLIRLYSPRRILPGRNPESTSIHASRFQTTVRKQEDRCVQKKNRVAVPVNASLEKASIACYLKRRQVYTRYLKEKLECNDLRIA